MKIIIEDRIHAGTPVEIMEQLWDSSFDGERFGSLEQYMEYVSEGFERLTDMPCKLPEGSLAEKAEALLAMLAQIDALEVLEDA